MVQTLEKYSLVSMNRYIAKLKIYYFRLSGIPVFTPAQQFCIVAVKSFTVLWDSVNLTESNGPNTWTLRTNVIWCKMILKSFYRIGHPESWEKYSFVPINRNRQTEDLIFLVIWYPCLHTSAAVLYSGS